MLSRFSPASEACLGGIPLGRLEEEVGPLLIAEALLGARECDSSKDGSFLICGVCNSSFALFVPPHSTTML